jgi:hypothetical protein
MLACPGTAARVAMPTPRSAAFVANVCPMTERQKRNSRCAFTTGPKHADPASAETMARTFPAATTANAQCGGVHSFQKLLLTNLVNARKPTAPPKKPGLPPSAP